MSVGQSMPRVDAYEKVTGRAMYTDDLVPQNALVAKLVRSNIANGLVKSFNLDDAKKVPGVVKILTCFDVPQKPFPTAGHPWSTSPSHQDVADRLLLNTRIRVFADDIAVVIAEDEIAAQKAARLVKVEYEEYDAYVDVEEAMAKDAKPLHNNYPDNILKHTTTCLGEKAFDEVANRPGLVRLLQTFDTQVVQHCHIEVPVSHAWMDKGRVVIVSSTQIPHIVRRVTSQATGLSFGKIRVIKPYIGGGFGNKQEVLYEPLNAWLTTKIGGRCVKLELSREETMASTRTRHAIRFIFDTAADKDGTLVARNGTAYSNQGGYASHGHSIVANAANVCHMLYGDKEAHLFNAYTVFTNLPAAGAMRGYGIPQAIFALECHMDDLAAKIGMDPIAIRQKNHMQLGFVDKGTGITCHSTGLAQCIEKGKKYIDWDKKRAQYQNQSGFLRRGVGMAIFCYKTGVYPISLETASARIVLNQDGTVQLQMGATEIGQGADTAFAQMCAHTIGIAPQDVHVVSTQDTDLTPFDTGAYASRQTYVSGMALKKTALVFRSRVLSYAAGLLQKEEKELDIKDANITDAKTGKVLSSLADVALEAFYSLTNSRHITAEETHHCTDNTFSFGACFAEVEVDIPLGKINVLNIINVHDSGVLINPQMAQAQVHGGMSMALGYALGEQMLFTDKAKPLNANLLDYKLPTSLDTPELCVDFVETEDPTGPYGNKSLGEPPAIPAAPAIRNAVLQATGVGINSLPMTPQKMVEAFTKAGLIKSVGGES